MSIEPKVMCQSCSRYVIPLAKPGGLQWYICRECSKIAIRDGVLKIRPDYAAQLGIVGEPDEKP